MSGRQRIIIVDDNMANLTVARQMLHTFYEVFPAPSAAAFFQVLENVTPDLVLMDIEMPEMNGYEAVKKFKGDNRFSDIPVIFLTAKSDEKSELEGFDLGAADYVSKPFSAPLLLRRISNQLLIVKQKKELLAKSAALQDYSENLEHKVQEKTSEVLSLQNAVLTTVADLVEWRDKVTGGHILRTQCYIKSMTDELIRQGIYSEIIDDWNIDFFLQSAQLHDVGKIAISDLILNKPDKLTPEEFDIMKGHVDIGVDIIERIIGNTYKHAFLNHALLVAGTHHEKWNGAGYPVGLSGTNIPLQGRIMAVADVYDALISARPYKPAFSHEEACNIIEADSGTHFDPKLIDVFRTVKHEFEQAAIEINAANN